jgi:hypothetical protein
VQSSPNVGFGVDDHRIRELMSFTKMISREFIFEDVTWKGGAPNHFLGWLRTQRRFNFFLHFKFEYRKSCTIKGTHLLVQNVQPSAHILSKASSSIHQISSQIVFQSLLFGECGSAALGGRQCRT